MSHQANITGREAVEQENFDGLHDTAQTQVMQKTIAVEIKGTMNGFSVMGPSAAT
jgi:hypothetical protein